jgi:hypothetical protein
MGKSNGTINLRPNNSFDRSRISSDVIRKIEGCSQILPARSIRALGRYARSGLVS